MNEYEARRLDQETDKLGSVTLAQGRLDFAMPEDEDRPRRKSPSRQRRPRPTGRPLVEPSGRDIERMISNKAAIEEPDPLTPEERREATKRGLAAVRAVLPSPVDRAHAVHDAEIEDAPADDYGRAKKQADLAFDAKMRIIADQKNQDK